MKHKIICGDCIEVVQEFEVKVDMILCDLPYGTTACSWDTIIPFKPLWEQYKRIIKDNGAIVLTASQPFTSALVMSNLEMFKHEWIWIKNRGSNFANTAREPMKEHESILVFGNKKWTYNKQMQERTGGGIDRVKYKVAYNNQQREGTRKFEGREHHTMGFLRVPSSHQKFNVKRGLHPTQKPVALFEYLIKTYTNKGDLVLDNCVGSGTTLVASERLKRNSIGIDLLEKWCETSYKRLTEEIEQTELGKEHSEIQKIGF